MLLLLVCTYVSLMYYPRWRRNMAVRILRWLCHDVCVCGFVS